MKSDLLCLRMYSMLAASRTPKAAAPKCEHAQTEKYNKHSTHGFTLSHVCAQPIWSPADKRTCVMPVWRLRSAQKSQIPGPLSLLAAQQSPTSLYLCCPPPPFTKCPTHSDHCWPLTISQHRGLAQHSLCVVTGPRSPLCLQTQYVKMEHIQQVWWAWELWGHWVAGGEILSGPEQEKP